MRVLLIAAAAVVVAACTPRDNRESDVQLRQSPEAAVYGEPTVTGGAYDSIIYRVGRERGLSPAGAHGAPPAGGAHGGVADSVALDSAAGHPSDESAAGGAAAGESAPGDSAAQQTGGGPTH